MGTGPRLNLTHHRLESSQLDVNVGDGIIHALINIDWEQRLPTPRMESSRCLRRWHGYCWYRKWHRGQVSPCSIDGRCIRISWWSDITTGSPPVLQFLGSYQHTVIAYTVTSRPLQPAKRRDWLVSFPDVFLRSVRKYLFRKGAHRCNHWWGFNTVKVHNVSRILDNSNDSIADVVDKLQDPIILPFILNFVSGQFRNRCKSWINSRIDLFRIWLPISKNLAKTELSLERAGLLLKEGSQGRCGCSQWRGNSEGLRRSLYYSPKFHFNVLKTRRSGWK